MECIDSVPVIFECDSEVSGFDEEHTDEDVRSPQYSRSPDDKLSWEDSIVREMTDFRPSQTVESKEENDSERFMEVETPFTLSSPGTVVCTPTEMACSPDTDSVTSGFARGDPFERFRRLGNDVQYSKRRKDPPQRFNGKFDGPDLSHTCMAMQLQGTRAWPQYNAVKWHRPQFIVETGTVFQREHWEPELLPGVPSQDAFKKPEDLSLKDDKRFGLFEFVEQHPLMMQNVGMASRIIQYHKGSTASSPSFGESVEADRLPLMQGHLQPPIGQTVAILENNLYRAPIFEHKPKSTDFLLVRRHGKMTVRPMENVYTVGQAEPMVPVEHPKAANFKKYVRRRIKRELHRKHGLQRDNIEQQLVFAFPQESLRNLRKDIDEVVDDLGIIKKADEVTLSKLVTPDQVCQMEATLWALQRFRDFGTKHYLAPDKQVDTAIDFVSRQEASMKSPNPMAPRMTAIRAMLNRAPWFLSAEHLEGGMLSITGDGDPSNGRGDAINFTRLSNKEIQNRLKANKSKGEVAKKDWDFRTIKRTDAIEKLRKYGVSDSEIQAIEHCRHRVIDHLKKFVKESDKGAAASKPAFTEAYVAQIRQVWAAQIRAFSPEDPEISDDEEKGPCQMDLEKEMEADMDLAADLEADLLSDLVNEEEQEEQELNKFRQVFDEESSSFVGSEKAGPVKRLRVFKLNKKKTTQCTYVFGDSIPAFKQLSKPSQDPKPENITTGKIVLKFSETDSRGSKRPREFIVKPAKKKPRTRKSLDRLYKDLNNKITSVLRTYVNNKDCEVFMKKVTPESGAWAENYLQIIRNPISIQCMKKKARTKAYRSLQEFQSDYQCLVDNSARFNGIDNHYTNIAREMQKKVKEAIKKVELSEVELDIKSVTEDSSTPTTCPSPDEPSDPEEDAHEIGGLVLAEGAYCED